MKLSESLELLDVIEDKLCSICLLTNLRAKLNILAEDLNHEIHIQTKRDKV